MPGKKTGPTAVAAAAAAALVVAAAEGGSTGNTRNINGSNSKSKTSASELKVLNGHYGSTAAAGARVTQRSPVESPSEACEVTKKNGK
jgi:hypothetical protein